MNWRKLDQSLCSGRSKHSFGFIHSTTLFSAFSLRAGGSLCFFQTRDSARRISGRHIRRVEDLGRATKRGGGGEERNTNLLPLALSFVINLPLFQYGNRIFHVLNLALENTNYRLQAGYSIFDDEVVSHTPQFFLRSLILGRFGRMVLIHDRLSLIGANHFIFSLLSRNPLYYPQSIAICRLEFHPRCNGTITLHNPLLLLSTKA